MTTETFLFFTFTGMLVFGLALGYYAYINSTSYRSRSRRRHA